MDLGKQESEFREGRKQNVVILLKWLSNKANGFRLLREKKQNEKDIITKINCIHVKIFFKLHFEVITKLM